MLEERILNDYKEAMKKKDALAVSTLSFLRSQLKNVAIEKRKDVLEDIDVVAIIKKQIKQRLDSVEQFQSGGRDDLAEKEKKELGILRQYVPEEISASALENIIVQIIGELGAQDMKDMGKVMKEVLVRVEGRAESKAVSELVRQKLSK